MRRHPWPSRLRRPRPLLPRIPLRRLTQLLRRTAPRPHTPRLLRTRLPRRVLRRQCTPHRRPSQRPSLMRRRRHTPLRQLILLQPRIPRLTPPPHRTRPRRLTRLPHPRRSPSLKPSRNSFKRDPLPPAPRPTETPWALARSGLGCNLCAGGSRQSSFAWIQLMEPREVPINLGFLALRALEHAESARSSSR